MSSTPSEARALPPAIQAHIGHAYMQRPPRRLLDLVSLLQTQPMNQWSTHPQVLGILCRQFEDSLPNLMAKNYEDRIEAVLDGVHGLQIAMQEIILPRTSSTTKKSVSSIVVWAWPSIWKWLHYLYYTTDKGLATTFDAKSRPAGATLPVRLPCQALIAYLLINTEIPIPSAISSTPGLLQMVTEMWVRLTDRPRDDQGLIEDSMFISMGLSELLKCSTTDVRPMARGFGIGKKELALALLKPFHRVIYGGEFWMDCYPAVIDVHLVLFQQVPDLYDQLSLGKIVYDICYALEYLTSIPIPESSDVMLLSRHLACITRSLIFIAGLSVVATGYQWIVQALRFKLIRSLLRSALWMPEDQLKDSSLRVLNILRTYLLCPPVLQPLQKAMDAAKAGDLAMKFNPEQGMTFMLHWMNFLNFYAKITATRKASEKIFLEKKHCALPGCKKVEGSNKFKTCSACFGAIYCSRACQRRDWKSGNHRKACEPTRQYKPTSRDPFRSPRNLEYFRYTLDQEIKKWGPSAGPKIRENMLSLLPSRDSQQPGILFFDHTQNPPKVDLRLACMVPELTTEFFSSLPEVHPFLVPCIALPYGKTRRVIYIPTRVSGELFGWFNRRGAHPETYGCRIPCPGHPTGGLELSKGKSERTL